MALEEVLRACSGAPPHHELHLADPWPWTTATPAAIGDARPVWSARAIPVHVIQSIAEPNADLAVRELNRRADPGPRAAPLRRSHGQPAKGK